MEFLRNFFSWNGTAGRKKYFFGCVGAFTASALASLLLLALDPNAFLFFFLTPALFLFIFCPILLILTKQRLKTLNLSSSLLFIFPFGSIVTLASFALGFFGITFFIAPKTIPEMAITPFVYVCLLTLFPDKPTNVLGKYFGTIIEKTREFLSAKEPISLIPFAKRALPSLALLYLLMTFSYNSTLAFVLGVAVYIYLFITTVRRLSTLHLPLWMIIFFPYSYGVVMNFVHLHSTLLNLDNLIHVRQFLVAIFYYIVIVGFFYTFSRLFMKNGKNFEFSKEERS